MKQICPCCQQARAYLMKDERNKGSTKICIFCIKGYGGKTKEVEPTFSDEEYMRKVNKKIKNN